MSNIAFFMLPEPGHLNPCFKLAKRLMASGHKPYFFGPPSTEGYIRNQGCDFKPTASSLYPPGSMIWGDRLRFRGGNSGPGPVARPLPVERASAAVAPTEQQIADIGNTLKELRIDIILLDPWCGGQFHHYLSEYEITTPLILLNPILFLPFLPTDEVGRFVYKRGIPILFFCPQEFDYARTDLGNLKHFYVEPSIDLERKEVGFAWEALKQGQPLIYCSLGSQSHRFGGVAELIRKVICALGDEQVGQLVVSIGPNLDAAAFQSFAQGAAVTREAPQLQMIKRASVVITHGGLGTIKECLYFGVPMLVFPFDTDQPENAKRVAFHGLGISSDPDACSVEQIRLWSHMLSSNPLFRDRAQSMSQKFKEIESDCRADKIITEMLKYS